MYFRYPFARGSVYLKANRLVFVRFLQAPLECLGKLGVNKATLDATAFLVPQGMSPKSQSLYRQLS